MKFCAKCGKELLDEAVVCPGCGNEIDTTSVCAQKGAKKVLLPKINKLWLILGASILVLGIIAAVLFMPRNLKMDSFKKTNVVTAIIQYGLPHDINTDDERGLVLEYKNKVDFYGITPTAFTVYPEEDRVVFFFSGNDDDSYDIYKKIERYCDFERSLASSYHIFSYNNLEITTYDYDASYVSIEID